MGEKKAFLKNQIVPHQRGEIFGPNKWRLPQFFIKGLKPPYNILKKSPYTRGELTPRGGLL